MKLTVSAMTMMKAPGIQNSHGRSKTAVCPSLISRPSEVSGAWTPKPR